MTDQTQSPTPQPETPPPLPDAIKDEAQHRKAPPPYRPLTTPGHHGKETNGYGLGGFVLALLSVFSFCIYPFGIPSFLGWVLALILSCKGLGRRPKTLAIIGFCLSLIAVASLVCLAIFTDIKIEGGRFGIPLIYRV